MRDGSLFPALLLILTIAVSGCPSNERGNGSGEKPTTSTASDQGLLTAYFLLEDTLSQEAKLGALGFLKKITFDRPVPEIDEIMDQISEISKERLDELEELRALSPDVSSDPEFMDPIGEAITSNATDAGMDEMLDRDGSFGIRFVFLQAQATRMVSAIARSAAGVETNERRKEWLGALSVEFEAIRDDLVRVVEKYVLQEGAAQKK